MPDGEKPDRRKLGRRSRRKGKDWEQQVARDLRPLFGEGVKRGLRLLEVRVVGRVELDLALVLVVESREDKAVTFHVGDQELRGLEHLLVALALVVFQHTLQLCAVIAGFRERHLDFGRPRGATGTESEAHGREGNRQLV